MNKTTIQPHSPVCGKETKTAIDISLLSFDAEQHTYHYDGRPLSGVTSMMKRMLFANKYIDIPEAALLRAAYRGSSIHAEAELVDTLDIEPTTPEVVAYVRMRERAGLIPIATEQFVTDGEHIASAIDVVMKDGETGELVLGDIKCTATLDILYLRWQLSIYAFLYKLVYGESPVRLVAFHLPRVGKPRMVNIDRIEDEHILHLIACDKAGTDYDGEYRPEQFDNPPEDIQSLVSDLKDIEQRLQALTAQRDDLKAGLLEAMQTAGAKKWALPDASLCIIPASTRRTFDTKAFGKDYPEIAEGYYKETTTKEQIRITLR